MKNIKDLMEMKHDGIKLSMVTAYDYPSAKQVEAAGIDTILVGDSLGMTVLGYESTVSVTLEDMIHHARAVRRGAPETFVVVDMPFGSVGASMQDDMKNAIKLYRTTHAQAIKIEGQHFELIRKCQQIGIPVVSHLGLTPQSVGIMGYSVQAQSEETARQLMNDAKRAEAAGAVMLVLEAIPSDLAALISQTLTIPVIGIGAGIDTDGQVLVYHDVLQYGTERKPKFVKIYGDFSTGVQSLKQFHEEVRNGQFPDETYTYQIKVLGEHND
ncbi:3-methyl-2-oxobutanoate hydroxymethyltransferase [Macrococcus hajekii]|uniref:3-methyl-2-oxobutanoate hydroxymethyltransferase n=1 Tax=Macrococcus hajekii TaxID=198482 RepID=A0A4R6BMP1_9STAP|nr:3-methyl-2-oxobutanoate hydroxymethyltransferase [Macrococcus hajekii]TDM03103.1 3-methyl-2-oxobutanoate hydroxymethyltransferase [Macrococcus hajekii]GGA95987.1 3-methyl-2-oxobutanoate hydroxymethyltransferase [Macrococcus hajekii]